MQTRSLLDLTHLHGVDYAKLDVEGHEPNILMPFFEVAEDEALPRYLQLEAVKLGEGAENLFAAISGRGYKNVFQTQRNIIFKR